MTNQEFLDIFDENMTHIGKAPRSEVHKKGYWHQTFHCWLINRSGDHQFVLFQRRGPDKRLFPNALDITAAGHLLAGETPEDGTRELNEELGLSAKFQELISLGIRFDIAKVGSIINREFCHVFLFESNLALNEYKLQPDEVTGIVKMDIQDGMKLFSGKVLTVPVSGYQVDENGIKHKVDLKVSKEDIIPRIDGYYMKICIMTERYFQNKPYLSI